jgi:NAD(P)H dehydrogenase (quinone)
MLLVTGATGHPGSAEADGLLKRTKLSAPYLYNVLFAGLSTAIKQAEFAKTSGDPELLLGRKPASLNEYINSVFSKN